MRTKKQWAQSASTISATTRAQNQKYSTRPARKDSTNQQPIFPDLESTTHRTISPLMVTTSFRPINQPGRGHSWWAGGAVLLMICPGECKVLFGLLFSAWAWVISGSLGFWALWWESGENGTKKKIIHNQGYIEDPGWEMISFFLLICKTKYAHIIHHFSGNGRTFLHSSIVKYGCSIISKFCLRCNGSKVPKIVDSTQSRGVDLRNCKCLAELFMIRPRYSDLNGRLATRPWKSGQHKLTLTLFYCAIAKICSSVLA